MILCSAYCGYRTCQRKKIHYHCQHPKNADVHTYVPFPISPIRKMKQNARVNQQECEESAFGISALLRRRPTGSTRANASLEFQLNTHRRTYTPTRNTGSDRMQPAGDPKARQRVPTAPMIVVRLHTLVGQLHCMDTYICGTVSHL